MQSPDKAQSPAAASKCLTTISSPLAFPVRTLKPVVGASRQIFPGSRIFNQFFREPDFLTGD
jgi:hypothetical protein